MAFSEEVKVLALRRAGWVCECTRLHLNHLGGRCRSVLFQSTVQFHHVTADAKGGADTLSNCEALCIPCHKQTDSYGRHS
jgi:5-methylcytosine-specific restriction endonuclease McrA